MKETDLPRAEEQRVYMRRVREILNESYAVRPNACVKTYGCQQNVSDSERIKGVLSEMGYALTDDPENADFVLFNTCAVREHAEDRVFGNLGALKAQKRRRPHMIICLCGCMAGRPEVCEQIKSSYPYVDLVVGARSENRLPEYVFKRLTGGARVFGTDPDDDIVEDLPVRRDGDIRGWLPIMYGCDNFCTYCIVPYVRGRERSRSPENILKEARDMINSGFREITLLGQNVNSYGRGTDVNFSALLRMIDGIDGDFRIRFMTSHPKDCTRELIDTIASSRHICHALHLPVQSGSDEILRRMNRGYTRERYFTLIDYAREKIPDITLTSDIIVGFPGETEEDFEDTLSAVERVKYASLFTFIYSKREGTPAASMQDPITRAEKGERFSRLLALQERITREHNKNMLGREYIILCEGAGRSEGLLSGRTDGGITVEFEGDASLSGQFVKVRIDRAESSLFGTVVK